MALFGRRKDDAAPASDDPAERMRELRREQAAKEMARQEAAAAAGPTAGPTTAKRDSRAPAGKRDSRPPGQKRDSRPPGQKKRDSRPPADTRPSPAPVPASPADMSDDPTADLVAMSDQVKALALPAAAATAPSTPEVHSKELPSIDPEEAMKMFAEWETGGHDDDNPDDGGDDADGPNRPDGSGGDGNGGGGGGNRRPDGRSGGPGGGRDPDGLDDELADELADDFFRQRGGPEAQARRATTAPDAAADWTDGAASPDTGNDADDVVLTPADFDGNAYADLGALAAAAPPPHDAADTPDEWDERSEPLDLGDPEVSDVEIDVASMTSDDETDPPPPPDAVTETDTDVVEFDSGDVLTSPAAVADVNRALDTLASPAAGDAPDAEPASDPGLAPHPLDLPDATAAGPGKPVSDFSDTELHLPDFDSLPTPDGLSIDSSSSTGSTELAVPEFSDELPAPSDDLTAATPVDSPAPLPPVAGVTDAEPDVEEPDDFVAADDAERSDLSDSGSAVVSLLPAGGLLLEAEGVVTAEDLTLLAGNATPLGRALRAAGGVPRDELHELLARYTRMPRVDLADIEPDPGARTRLPERLARQFELVPLAHTGDVLVVAGASAEPGLIRQLREATGCRVKFVLGEETAVRTLLEHVYPPNFDEDETVTLHRSTPGQARDTGYDHDRPQDSPVDELDLPETPPPPRKAPPLPGTTRQLADAAALAQPAASDADDLDDVDASETLVDPIDPPHLLPDFAGVEPPARQPGGSVSDAVLAARQTPPAATPSDHVPPRPLRRSHTPDTGPTNDPVRVKARKGTTRRQSRVREQAPPLVSDVDVPVAGIVGVPPLASDDSEPGSDSSDQAAPPGGGIRRAQPRGGQTVAYLTPEQMRHFETEEEGRARESDKEEPSRPAPSPFGYEAPEAGDAAAHDGDFDDF